MYRRVTPVRSYALFLAYRPERKDSFCSDTFLSTLGDLLLHDRGTFVAGSGPFQPGRPPPLLHSRWIEDSAETHCPRLIQFPKTTEHSTITVEFGNYLLYVRVIQAESPDDLYVETAIV